MPPAYSKVQFNANGKCFINVFVIFLNFCSTYYGIGIEAALRVGREVGPDKASGRLHDPCSPHVHHIPTLHVHALDYVNR